LKYSISIVIVIVVNDDLITFLARALEFGQLLESGKAYFTCGVGNFFRKPIINLDYNFGEDPQ
jgi:hypothetical protein